MISLKVAKRDVTAVRSLKRLNMGATRTRDRLGLAGTLSRVLAFGTIGSRVPGFDVIAITDLISFLPLDSDAMCMVIVRCGPLLYIDSVVALCFSQKVTYDKRIF